MADKILYALIARGQVVLTECRWADGLLVADISDSPSSFECGPTASCAAQHRCWKCQPCCSQNIGEAPTAGNVGHSLALVAVSPEASPAYSAIAQAPALLMLIQPLFTLVQAHLILSGPARLPCGRFPGPHLSMHGRSGAAAVRLSAFLALPDLSMFKSMLFEARAWDVEYPSPSLRTSSPILWVDWATRPRLHQLTSWMHSTVRIWKSA